MLFPRQPYGIRTKYSEGDANGKGGEADSHVVRQGGANGRRAFRPEIGAMMKKAVAKKPVSADVGKPERIMPYGGLVSAQPEIGTSLMIAYS